MSLEVGILSSSTFGVPKSRQMLRCFCLGPVAAKHSHAAFIDGGRQYPWTTAATGSTDLVTKPPPQCPPLHSSPPYTHPPSLYEPLHDAIDSLGHVCSPSTTSPVSAEVTERFDDTPTRCSAPSIISTSMLTLQTTAHFPSPSRPTFTTCNHLNDRDATLQPTASASSPATSPGMVGRSCDFVHRLVPGVSSTDVPRASRQGHLREDLTNLTPIGRGQHWRCYKADWHGACVAAKIIVSDTAEELQQSMTEAVTSRMLAHPHIVHTYAATVMPVEPRHVSELTTHRFLDEQSPSHSLGSVIDNLQVEELLMGHKEQGQATDRGGALFELQPACGNCINRTQPSNYGGSPRWRKNQLSDPGCPARNPSMEEEVPRVPPGLAPFDHGRQSLAADASDPEDVHLTMAAWCVSGTRAGLRCEVAAAATWPSAAAAGLPSTAAAGSAAAGSSSSGAAGEAVPVGVIDRDGGGSLLDLGCLIRPAGSTLPLTRTSTGNFSFGGGEAPLAASLDDVLCRMNLKLGQHITAVVMEFCDRGCLGEAIQRGSFRPSDRWGINTSQRALVRTAKEVAQGLAHLHSLGITHGDLKPGNVLLKSSRGDRRGFTARLSDYGMSTERGVSAQARGPLLASKAYVAPEAFESPVTPASDIWSFGVILFEMITGKNPFVDLTWGQEQAGRPDGTLRLDWPSVLDPVMRRLGEACTMWDPAGRPSSMVVSKVMLNLDQELVKSSSSSLSSKRSSAPTQAPRCNSCLAVYGGASKPARGSSPCPPPPLPPPLVCSVGWHLQRCLIVVLHSCVVGDMTKPWSGRGWRWFRRLRVYALKYKQFVVPGSSVALGTGQGGGWVQPGGALHALGLGLQLGLTAPYRMPLDYLKRVYKKTT